MVVKADVEIGYLHRAFEKDCEAHVYGNAIPYTDRLNYVSPLINNFGYASAVEKLLGIEITERCKYIRVIMSEISRICDHLTCVGASAMELGAFTVFLYMIKAREFLWELVEDVTGARLTISYGRIGGVKADLPGGLRPQGEEGLRGDAPGAGGSPQADHRQPHLHGPDGRRRRALPRGHHRVGDHGTAPAGGRRPVRPAEDAAVLGVRPDGLRSPARQERRQLRPLPRAHGRDGAGDADRRAGARGHPRGLDPGGLGGAGDRSRHLRRPRQAGEDRGPPPHPDHALAESPGPGSRRSSRASTCRTSASCCRRRRRPTDRSRD